MGVDHESSVAKAARFQISSLAPVVVLNGQIVHLEKVLEASEVAVVVLSVCPRISRFVLWVVVQVLGRVTGSLTIVLGLSGTERMGSGRPRMFETLDAVVLVLLHPSDILIRLTEEYDVLWPFCCNLATSCN